jgi:hypothetical protein
MDRGRQIATGNRAPDVRCARRLELEELFDKVGERHHAV